MLEKFFRSTAEVKVLGTVLSSDGLHLREIARRSGVSAPETKRELDLLESAGVLRKARKGNLSAYSLRRDCPFLPELQGLYFKTEGVVAELVKAIGRLKRAKWAFVYGSFADGTFAEKSDVDVMVVGSVDEGEVSRGCFAVQKKTGWAIHPVVWTEGDLAEKARETSALLKSLLRKKKIWLAGDESEFKRIAETARS